MKFQTPYSRSNKLRRFVWNLVWACLARPFPRSMAMGWKRFLLRLFGAKITNTANVYALEFGNERLCLHSIRSGLL